jgi:hypothetical protein
VVTHGNGLWVPHERFPHRGHRRRDPGRLGRRLLGRKLRLRALLGTSKENRRNRDYCKRYDKRRSFSHRGKRSSARVRCCKAGYRRTRLGQRPLTRPQTSRSDGTPTGRLPGHTSVGERGGQSRCGRPCPSVGGKLGKRKRSPPLGRETHARKARRSPLRP